MIPLNAAERDTLLRLARASVEQAVLGGTALSRAKETAQLTPALLEPRAAFVTLRDLAVRDRSGAPELRGCLGTLEPRESLALDVIRNAASAAREDPRFPGIRPEELPSLWIEVSALTPLRVLADAREIVVGRDGVELIAGTHRSVFLPQVAVEHGWDTPRLLEQLARKAGLPADGWRGATLRVFEAEVFHDPLPGREP